jgi:hypothetical protein
MPSSVTIRTLFALAVFFVATNARAQSQMEEIDSLPIPLSAEQFQSLQQLSPIAISSPRTTPRASPSPKAGIATDP